MAAMMAASSIPAFAVNERACANPGPHHVPVCPTTTTVTATVTDTVTTTVTTTVTDTVTTTV